MDLIDIRNKINDIDKDMASLFEKRMELVKDVIEYKIKNNLPILDSNREKQVIDNNLGYIKNEEFKEYYIKFITEIMNESKDFQKKYKG